MRNPAPTPAPQAHDREPPPWQQLGTPAGHAPDPGFQSDEAAAKAAGYRGITAPPTFLRALQADDPNKGGLLKLLNVDIGLILHGEQHFEYFAPVVVGDKVTCQEKVVDIYDKKGGALWFVVQEMEMKDQTGKLVAKGKGVTVVRNPDAAKK